MGTAVEANVVVALRKRLSAVALVVAFVATAGGSAFAHHRHPACETRQHDCGQPAKISNCCCGDLRVPSDAGTPLQSRSDVASGVASAPVPQFEHPVLTSDDAIAVQASPPRSACLDLTTRFACLLI